MYISKVTVTVSVGFTATLIRSRHEKENLIEATFLRIKLNSSFLHISQYCCCACDEQHTLLSLI